MKSNDFDQQDVSDALLSDLTELHSVLVPPLRFDARRAEIAEARRPFFRRFLRPLAGVAAAGIAAAIVLGLTSPLTGSTPTVSAEVILERANSAAVSQAPAGAQKPSYHLVARNVYDKGGASTTGFVTETWYGGSGLFRTEQRDDGTLVFGAIDTTSEVWVYRTGQSGSLLVAHGATAELGRFVMTPDLQPQSLAAFLAQYDNSCQKATITGDDTVAGRSTYVILVEAVPEKCLDASDPALQKKVAAEKWPSLKLWVDRETFLPLRTQSADKDGNFVTNYEVTVLETNASIPSDTFRLTPPDGAKVTEVTNYSDAKMAIWEPPISSECAPTDSRANCQPQSDPVAKQPDMKIKE